MCCALTMPYSDYNHFFVKKHRSCYQFLKKLHDQLKYEFCVSFCYLGPIVLFDSVWSLKVYEWYRNFVSTSYYYKKKHFYLYGSSNFGKTYFISLLTKYLFNRVYYVSDGQPLFDINTNHKVIIFDEFVIRKYNLE